MGSDYHPLDGGWGWVIVVCSIINHASTIGLMMSLSVLYVSWLDQFGAGKGVTSWILSVGVAFMFGLCVVPANLATKYGFRVVGFIGGILTCAGLTASAFARSITDLILSIGFVAGIGCCFCYLPAVAMVALYFEKRRSLAMGIATAGTGIGAFGFAPLLAFLEEKYGWRGALLLLAALSLHMCITSLLFRPLEPNTDETDGGEVDRDRSTEFPRAGEARDLTVTISEAEAPRLYEDYFSTGNKDDAASSVVGMHSQLQSRDINVSDDIYPYTEGDGDIIGESKGSDRSFFPSRFEQVSENYMTNNGVENWTGNLAPNNDTPHTHNGVNETNRLFVSLDDFRRMHTKTSHHHFSLHSLSSCKKGNKSIEISTLRNIRNVDIHLLASIRHLLEKNERDQTVTPLLSSGIDNKAQKHSESSRTRPSIISRCLSSRTLRANLDMLQDKRFLTFAISNFLNNLAFISCVVHLVDRAVFHGIDKSVGAIIISANGFGNIFGRLFFGWLANRMCSNHLLMYISTLIICGLGTVASPLCGQSAILHGSFAVFFGSMMGVYVILAPLVTVYLMGVAKVATAYGLVLFFMGPATVVGAPFAGLLFDWTKTYLLSYVVNGIFLLASGVMMVPLLRSTKKNQSKPSEENTSLDIKSMEVSKNQA